MYLLPAEGSMKGVPGYAERTAREKYISSSPQFP